MILTFPDGGAPNLEGAPRGVARPAIPVMCPITRGYWLLSQAKPFGGAPRRCVRYSTSPY